MAVYILLAHEDNDPYSVPLIATKSLALENNDNVSQPSAFTWQLVS